MTERARKIVVAAEALALLLPLTVIVATMVAISYPAYPIPYTHPLQAGFDAAMLVTVLAIIAAWRLAWRYLRAGRRGLAAVHRGWLGLLAAGAALGLLGVGVAVEHMLNIRTANAFVGYALLTPAAVLAPLFLHWAWERRRA